MASNAVSATMRLRLALEGAAEALAHAQVEGLLGHPLGEMTPREVRAELVAYRRDQGLPV